MKSHHCIILEGLYCKYLFKAPGGGGGGLFFSSTFDGVLFNIAKCITGRKNTVVRDRADLCVVQVIVNSM